MQHIIVEGEITLFLSLSLSPSIMCVIILPNHNLLTMKPTWINSIVLDPRNAFFLHCTSDCFLATLPTKLCVFSLFKMIIHWCVHWRLEIFRFFSILFIYLVLALHHHILIQKLEPLHENIYETTWSLLEKGAHQR